MLTESQYKTFNFIKEFIAKQGLAPTIAEIAQGLGVKSRSHVHRNVQAIADDNLIELIPNKQRNIRIVEESHYDDMSLPLVGRIAAGYPIEAVAEQEQINFSQLFMGRNRYILEVKGDSMIGDNICDGDLVIIQRSQSAHNGDIVVALVDHQEATLKRFYSDQSQNRVRLRPSNPDFSEMVYEGERVQVQGIYLGLVRIAR